MVQLCDEEILTITSLMYGTADESTLLNVNFAYTNVDAASFAPEGDNTFTGTALRSGFEGNDIPFSLTDNGLEGSVVVTVTPYFDVDGDGVIDADDDCDGTPVTLTINVDPIPVISAEINEELIDADPTTDASEALTLMVCDEETVEVTDLIYGISTDDDVLLNVNFVYNNVDPASFAPAGDNTCLLYTSPSPRD